jgi:hypothetical protein
MRVAFRLIILLCSTTCFGGEFSKTWFPSTDSTSEVNLISQSGSIPLNLLTSFHLKIRTHANILKLSSVTFDASMPLHRHGMVTLARVKRLSQSEFQIEGVKLHMIGLWEFRIEALTDRGAKSFRVPYYLK